MEELETIEEEVETQEVELETGPEGVVGLPSVLIKTDLEALPSLEDIEKHIAYQKAIIKAITKITKPQDWISFAEKGKAPVYRMGHAGAKRIRLHLGISISQPKITRLLFTDNIGAYVGWKYEGTARFGNASIPVQAVVTQRQKFFAKAGAEWRPLADVSLSDILTMAYNTYVKKAVVDFFGLLNFTVEDLKELGYDTSKLKGYEFESKSSPPPAQNGKPSGIIATEKQIKMIFAKGHSMGWDEETIRKFIADRTGKASTKELTFPDINTLLAAYKEFEPREEG